MTTIEHGNREEIDQSDAHRNYGGKIEQSEEDNYLFILFRFPRYSASEGRITINQLYFFLGKDYLGYAVVAVIYLLLIIVINSSKDALIKTPLTNLVIAKLLKSKSKSNESKTNEDGVL